MRSIDKKIAAAILLSSISTTATAEVNAITFAHQNGWGYLPFYVMKEKGLVEKHAKEKKIDVKPEYKNLGTPGVIRDALLANQVQFAAVGVPTLISLADKTDFKAVGNIVSLPMYLNSREDVKSICDLKGKIALPTIKSSVQAVTLQMAAEKHCGKALALDDQTVSMTHPDGLANMLTDPTKAPITSHFTSPPFQYVEIEKGEGKIKKLLDSYDVLGGRTSFILLVGSDKFRTDNPKVYEVVVAAFEEALKWITENKEAASQLYVDAEKPKETKEEVLKQLSKPEVLWDSTPDRIGVYAKFMHKIGSVKNDMDWKFLSLPNLHDRKGS